MSYTLYRASTSVFSTLAVLSEVWLNDELWPEGVRRQAFDRVADTAPPGAIVVPESARARSYHSLSRYGSSNISAENFRLFLRTEACSTRVQEFSSVVEIVWSDPLSGRPRSATRHK